MFRYPGSGKDTLVPRRKSPLIPFLWLIVIGSGLYLYHTLSAAKMEEEVKEANSLVEAFTPEELSRMLFENQKLPAVIPFQVHGVLDLRMGYSKCKTLFPAGISKEVNQLTSIRVYGILYPPGSSVMERRFLLEEVARKAWEYQDRSEMESEEYQDLWDELAATYNELSKGTAVLVELDEALYPELYAQVREEALTGMNSRGKILHSSKDIDLHRGLTDRLLASKYLEEGTFRVQITDHNKGLAKKIEEDDFTSDLTILRTVKLLE